MKPFILILVLIWVVQIQTEINELLNLSGNSVQGGLIRGICSSEIKEVSLNNEQLPVFGNVFILGFDRDAEDQHHLAILLEDGERYELTLNVQQRTYRQEKITSLPQKYTDQPSDPELQNRIRQESRSITDTRKKIYKNAVFYDFDLSLPVDSARISSEFGNQRIINDVPRTPHNGIDLACPYGTEVKAAGNGKIALTGDYYYNGKFVLIDHGGGLNSIYMHLSEITVNIDDPVDKGTVIGLVGSTGRSTGAHLHWGVDWNGRRIDPALFLEMQERFFSFSRQKQMDENDEDP
ncbi:MAG: M23 family metallopeptidase [Candidatus Cloacimonetes bacterium]|nr:M23 family metallopeptidase [Candidatus Cloacimonadota bacterium]